MKPLSAPRVRVVSLLTCPNTHCSRTIYSPTIRAGEVWMKCNLAEKDRRGGCPAHWLNITLPAGATGVELVRVAGEEQAWRIIRALSTPPYWRNRAEAFAARFTSDDSRPVHLQLPCRARDEHHLRHAPLAAVLQALQIGGE